MVRLGRWRICAWPLAPRNTLLPLLLTTVRLCKKGRKRLRRKAWESIRIERERVFFFSVITFSTLLLVKNTLVFCYSWWPVCISCCVSFSLFFFLKYLFDSFPLQLFWRVVTSSTVHFFFSKSKTSFFALETHFLCLCVPFICFVERASWRNL